MIIIIVKTCECSPGVRRFAEYFTDTISLNPLNPVKEEGKGIFLELWTY